MQQKCIQFHTLKSFPQTLEIFEKEKLEIIFRSQNTHIDFADLTIEEQISWIQTREKKYMQRCDKFLKRHSGKFENLFESLTDLRKQTKELVKLYRSNPLSYKTSEKYEQFNEERKKLVEKYDYNALYDLLVHHFHDGLSVYCSCIIARKGNNVVRYLSFKKDPIVTIMGSKASGLKSSLESKF